MSGALSARGAAGALNSESTALLPPPGIELADMGTVQAGGDAKAAARVQQMGLAAERLANVRVQHNYGAASASDPSEAAAAAAAAGAGQYGWTWKKKSRSARAYEQGERDGLLDVDAERREAQRGLGSSPEHQALLNHRMKVYCVLPLGLVVVMAMLLLPLWLYAVQHKRLPEACGVAFTYNLVHDGRDRQLLVYSPPQLCLDNTPAPMVVVLHTLHIDAEEYVERMRPLSDELSFTLLAPQGVGKSWNAGPCCGEALEQGVDDVSFVLASVLKAQQVTKAFASSAVFLVGYDNGGFLAELLGMMPNNPFKAISPIAGYQYVGFRSVSRPMPIFQHHGRNDPTVQFEGCCTNKPDGVPPCEYDIDINAGPTCVSVNSAFDQWATDVNHCAPGPGVASYTEHEVDGIHCVTRQNCTADSILCVYDEGEHFVNHTPMEHTTALFFMRHACEQNGGGKWTGADYGPGIKCTCTPELGTVGKYCLRPLNLDEQGQGGGS